MDERHLLSDAMPFLFCSIPYRISIEAQLVSLCLARSSRCLAGHPYHAAQSELCHCHGSCRDDVDDSHMEQRVLVIQCGTALATLVYRCDGIGKRTK